MIPDPSQAGLWYDGVAELWFDSPEALQAAFESPEGQAGARGSAEFSRFDKAQILDCRRSDDRLRRWPAPPTSMGQTHHLSRLGYSSGEVWNESPSDHE